MRASSQLSDRLYHRSQAQRRRSAAVVLDVCHPYRTGVTAELDQLFARTRIVGAATARAGRAGRWWAASAERNAMAELRDQPIHTLKDLARFEAAMTLQERLPERSVLDVFIGTAARDPDRTAVTML